MPLKVIEPRRLYLEIAAQIRSLIEGGEFPPGSRLPAERELAKQMGVSRPSLREALIALEVEGYVDVRPGSGILVTTPTRSATNGSGDEGPLEIMRARRLIEAEIAAEVAPRIKSRDLAALEQILSEMEKAVDRAALLDADCRFHLYITAKLANTVLLRLIMQLLDQRNRLLGEQFATHLDNAKTWAAISGEHHRILAALAAGDSKQARKAMRDHLRNAYDRWAQQLDRA